MEQNEAKKEVKLRFCGLTKRYKEELLRRVAVEAHAAPADFRLPVFLDLTAAIAIIGNLQLAMRHPRNKGPGAAVARKMVDGLIEQIEQAGLPAHAELARTGENPENDA